MIFTEDEWAAIWAVVAPALATSASLGLLDEDAADDALRAIYAATARTGCLARMARASEASA